jgi:hypothetical protein
MSVSGTLTADGDSQALAPANQEHNVAGVFVHMSGGFGGGTATLYFKTIDNTWVALTNGAFTAAADKQVFVPNTTGVKITLSGSTTPTFYYQISNMSNS